MRARTIGRTLLIAGYGLLLAGLLAWSIAARTHTDPTPTSALLAIWLATGTLMAATWWHWQRAAQAPLPSAVGLAISAPLSMEPVAGIGGATALGVGLLVATVAMLPLAWILTGGMAQGPAGRVPRLAMGACLGAGAVTAGLVAYGAIPPEIGPASPAGLWWVLMSVALSIAAAHAACRSLVRSRETRGVAIVAALAYLGIAIAVSASGLALTMPWWPSLIMPVLAIIGTALVLGRVAIRPLTTDIGEVRAERDLVVSTLEAERGRIAATIHDGPLGDLALLVQRLDRSGDTAAAALARSIATDLRALGNELRLPILDDLGAGPAIEWLAGRVADRTHVPIRIDTQGVQARPPAPVELAIFRIAQEALINSAKHGRGPITVRYAARSSAAALAVTDAGPGITAAARRAAPGDGHLGLRLMAQRAESIGARLEIGASRSGGTSVRLEWTAT